MARKVALRARAPAGCPPHCALLNQLAPGNAGLRCRLHSYLFAPALSPPLKSRGHSLSALRAQRFLAVCGPARFPATAALPEAAGNVDPTVKGQRPLSAARTSTTVPSSDARGRGRRKAAARARPSSATGASETERSPSSLRCLFFFTAAAAASGEGKTCRSSLRDLGATCPLPSRPGKFLAAAAALRTSPGRQSPLSRCQQRRSSGALLGAAGEEVLLVLPQTPTWKPQALALGSC